MMPLGAPSISKYGSLVRPYAQIVALRARTALKAPPYIRNTVGLQQDPTLMSAATALQSSAHSA